MTKNLIIGNIYRSPSSNHTKFIERLDFNLKKLDRHKNKIIHLVGDFNVDLSRYDSDLHCHELINKMSEHSFAEVISIPTRITDNTSTIIDHIYSNQVHTIEKSRVITLDLSDHLGTYVQFGIDTNFFRENNAPLTETVNFRKFNAANLETFAELIRNESWDDIDKCTSANQQYEMFVDTYNKNYDKAFELKSTVRRKNQRKNPKPWITPWLEDACARKNDAYHLKITDPSPKNNANYIKLKKFTDRHIDLAKKKFYSDFFEEHQTDSRRQWQMINSLLNRNKKYNKITKIRDCNDNVASSPQEIADKFNNYFANIAAKLKAKLPQSVGDAHQFMGPSNENSIYLKPTDSTEVSQIIDNLKIKATSDINVASIKKAKETSQKFSEVIAKVINTSLTEGIFPTLMKTAKVVPIHKGDSKLDIQNYRPISLLSAFSKIFEKVMYSRLYEFLLHNNILIDNQFGFRKGRSCEHALLVAQNQLLTSLNKKQISMLLLLDFSKAFDMVDHKILLSKLQHYGIRGIAHAWISSYLNDRKQYVALNNKASSTLNMTYGVPQGSILGPLLFIIYINDIPNINNTIQFIMYADDANILITGKNMIEIEQTFNTLLKQLEIWIDVNGLALNLKKTNFMIFSSNKKDVNLTFIPKIYDYEISRKYSARFLGVIINHKLNWNDHIVAIRAKMSRYVGILFKLKKFIPISALKNIFHSFVQAHLNYCSLVWGLSCKSSIEKLFTEQKKAMRSIIPGYQLNYQKAGVNPTHTKPYFTKYKIATVHSIILINLLIFMFKYNYFKHFLPLSVAEIILPTAPNPNIDNDGCKDWLASHQTGVSRNAVSFKGPLFFLKYLQQIESTYNQNTKSHYISVNTFKMYTKSFVFDLQSQGKEDEWEGHNIPLHYVPGLPRGSRMNIPPKKYSE